ncbi:MAG: hypothetical protein IJB36_01360 [Clostridia bacterium]|nr:hypothetical protein [Clostridia bacterium]
MINSKTINAINKMYELKTIGFDFNMDELIDAVENCDYYVRPGDKRGAFMQECFCIMEAHKGNQEPLAVLGFIVALLALIKKSFDREYFEEQLAVTEEPVNKEVVKGYLDALDCEHLKEFVAQVVWGRLKHGLFISNSTSVHLWAELNARCVRKDKRIPSMDRVDYHALAPKDPLYYFDYLSREEIVDVFCDHIDKDAALIESAAKAFCDSGVVGFRACVILELHQRKQSA